MRKEGKIMNFYPTSMEKVIIFCTSGAAGEKAV